MDYYQRFNKVVDYIGEHLDDTLSLEELSDIFCVSKFHFHRLFTALTGLSLQQYIRWLRLKRAARQLSMDKDQSIIHIALNAGFESHEAFSRVFKKTCGVSPSQYRQGMGWSYWEKSPYSLPTNKERGNNMKVDVKNFNEVRLAAVEHRGDVEGLVNSLDKLIGWIKAQPGNIKLVPEEGFGIAYNDPKTTPPAEFCFDIGIKVPANTKISGDVVEKILPTGRYATVMHKGSRDNIGDTVYYLYRDWLPASGEQLGDFPCVFCYHNYEHDVAETELLTECRLLLK